MQKIRGIIYFEGKTIEDVKFAFDNLKLDETKISYFCSIKRYDENISTPGVFLSGIVNDDYASKDIVELFRKQIGLDTTLKGCDVSIESEDTIELLKDGNLKGNYIGIRIEPPYVFETICTLASDIGSLVCAKNILVRTVEKNEKEPLICIDLIAYENFEKYKNTIEDIITSKNLKIGKYTTLSFA